MRYERTPETSLSSSSEQTAHEILTEEEKARRTAARQMGVIQQELRGLMEQATAPVLESAPESSTGAQLLDAVRTLGGQMHALVQVIGQAPAEGPPQYTASPSS